MKNDWRNDLIWTRNFSTEPSPTSFALESRAATDPVRVIPAEVGGSFSNETASTTT